MSVRNWCPKCREETGLYEKGICPWCDTPLRHKGGQKPGGGKLRDQSVQALHLAHMDGRSIRELGEMIYVKAGYSSAHSAANSISAAFKRLGLPARGRLEATILASTIHGRAQRKPDNKDDKLAYRRELNRKNGKTHGRRCEGVRQQYPRKGEPCNNSALSDSGYCYQHDPRFEDARNARLEQMRLRRARRSKLYLDFSHDGPDSGKDRSQPEKTGA